MLPPAHRLRRSREFTEVMRRGRAVARGALSVHLLLDPGEAHPPRAGLVVGRAVGGSVVRHRTARRLRGLLRSRVLDLPAGSRVVVRAAGPAGAASSALLARDLDAALTRLRA